MALRTDNRQWLIYNPNTVDMVFKALEASALVMYGGWLQQRARRLPSGLSGNVGTLGAILAKMGDARQQIQAGLAPNDVPDELVESQRGLDLFVRYLNGDRSVDFETVVNVIDQITAAMSYMDQRVQDTGTNHPRSYSMLVQNKPCESCGR